MRDNDGFSYTQKQRKRYLESIKLLYGTPQKTPIGIVQPRLNLEDLGLVHEKPEQKRLCKAQGLDQGQLSISGTNVPRGTRGAHKTKTPRTRKEWREQEDIYKWTQTVQSLRGHVMMIGNEGRRSLASAAVAKRMGLLSGVSDLFIAKPIGIYHGLWVEVKRNCTYTPAQRCTDHWKRQEAFQQRMRSVGYAATFAFGAEDGIKKIQEYLNKS